MLTADNISYQINGRVLVSDISLSLEPGKVHLFIGPNGAGKSTLVKLLARSTRPATGKIEYNGINIAQTGEPELAKHRAVLSQAIEIAFPLSVREVAMMGRYPHFSGSPGPTDKAVVDEMLAYFDVKGFSDRNYQTLSGGERQRVNFARVLAQLWRHEPHGDADGKFGRFLFLDEPLTFLDIHHQIDFMQKVRQLADEPDMVVIGVVHDLNLAARFADTIVLLENGRITANGTPAEVLTADTIHRAFNVNTTFVPVANDRPHLIFD